MNGIGIVLFDLLDGELVFLGFSSFGSVLRLLVAFISLIGTLEIHVPLAYGGFLICGQQQ